MASGLVGTASPSRKVIRSARCSARAAFALAVVVAFGVVVASLAASTSFSVALYEIRICVACVGLPSSEARSILAMSVELTAALSTTGATVTFCDVIVYAP
jgi:hypothetical protein